MLNTPLRRVRSFCTTRRSCWQTETSGSRKLLRLLVPMHLTDKGSSGPCDIVVNTIGAVLLDNTKRWVSFVNASSVY